MIRVIIGFVAGFTFAKVIDCPEFEEKVKSILQKCKDAIREEFKQKEEATETL